MLMNTRTRLMGRRCLVWMVIATLVSGLFTPAFAGWYQLPSFLRPPDILSLSEEEDGDAQQDRFTMPVFYMPDIYETHRITGYSAIALSILALATGGDSTVHKVSGFSAAVFGVAAGASGHIAYGEGIDFREGWTRENIHAGSGYLATAALVLTAALGASDKSHSAAGGVATAAVTVPVLVLVF